MAKVYVQVDNDGYITASSTLPDYDTVVEADPYAIMPGFSKLLDGKVIFDQTKMDAITAARDAAREPSVEEEIAQLKADKATMQAALMELSDFTFSSMAGGNS